MTPILPRFVSPMGSSHAARAPYHMLAEDVAYLTRASGFDADFLQTELPRGQVLIRATPS